MLPIGFPRNSQPPVEHGFGQACNQPASKFGKKVAVEATSGVDGGARVLGCQPVQMGFGCQTNGEGGSAPGATFAARCDLGPLLSLPEVQKILCLRAALRRFNRSRIFWVGTGRMSFPASKRSSGRRPSHSSWPASSSSTLRHRSSSRIFRPAYDARAGAVRGWSSLLQLRRRSLISSRRSAL